MITKCRRNNFLICCYQCPAARESYKLFNAGENIFAVAALKNSNVRKTGRIDGTKVLRTAITYDWEIRRHEISGAILHRYCITAMAVRT